MEANAPIPSYAAVDAHLANLADNLQLLADLAYGDMALAVPDDHGRLVVRADARPVTAVAPFGASRHGRVLDRDEEPEAYASLDSGESARGDRRRVARGISYTTTAYPVGNPSYAVIIKDVAAQIDEAPGKMEREFMASGDRLAEAMRLRPLEDLRTEAPFSTTRTAGDGLLVIDAGGCIDYASPNAVAIMRLAGFDRALEGASAAELPGGGYAISPVLGSGHALALDTDVAQRSLRYRSIALPDGALVLVEDVTEAKRREAELKVKEATIREVHHRVKNNLQTIASLLRIQARRTTSPEVERALSEATERVGSMAVVHDLLAGSEEENVDFTEVARPVVDLVRQGLMGTTSDVQVAVEGTTGLVDAHTATSLALVLAELVHNALEHGFADADHGTVTVNMRRVPGELVVAVRDDGAGLPKEFDPEASANLGLFIVRTVVEDDLRGTLTFSGGKGTTVTVRVPLRNEEAWT